MGFVAELIVRNFLYELIIIRLSPDITLFSAFTTLTLYPLRRSFETCEHILPATQSVASTVNDKLFFSFSLGSANYFYPFTTWIFLHKTFEGNEFPSGKRNLSSCSYRYT